ncbi:MAG: hypothetical protein CME59_11840 [Halioglobus sp.]|nr:hypothetical protein [Halioglobus sp.]|tara:strand:- start:213 stop:692 length:480 start_codon:yes stop_codon:yes gene_type:complete
MPSRLHLRNTVKLAALALLLLNTQAWAEAREQKVRLDVKNKDGQCQVVAKFKGDHDNCDNDKAEGRKDCKKDKGCVCTRREKRISWQMKDKKKYPFEIRFNQGSADPFVKSGENKCDLAGNKQGKLRCRVKGKGVPEGIYRYSIHVPGCDPTHAQFKVY